MAVGARNQVAISYLGEATFGTANTTKLMSFPYAGELPALDPKFEFLKDHIFGKFGQIGGELVELKGTWSPTMVLNPSNAAVLLFFLLGGIAKATHAGETVVYDFALTESNADTKSLTLVTSTDVSKLQWPGTKLKSIKLSGRSGQFWKVQPTFELAGVMATSLATMPAIKNEDNFTWKDAALTIGATDISTATAGFDLNINLASDASNEYGMGSLAMIANEITDRQVSGQILRRYADDTLINQIIAQNQATQTLALTLTGKQVPGSVASTNYSIALNLAAILFTKGAVTGGRNKLMLPLPFEGVYDLSAAKTLSASVTSGTDYTT